MRQLLDNIMWNCLAGPHARFATGSGQVRRYAPGFSPLVGFLEAEHPNVPELEQHVTVGESFYFDRWLGLVPSGWRIEKEATMFKMVWQGCAPGQDSAPDAVRLGAEHAPAALALATLTNPGPFGLRTLELGEYFGYFDGPRLIAMAGERLHAGTLREVSGICTHPEARGRGLAKKLTLKLVQRQLARGEMPFLHVLRHNTAARALYAELGFRDHCETVVRVVSRVGSGEPAAAP